MSNNTSLKVYLMNENSDEIVARRFSLQSSILSNYILFAAKISQVFPELSEKLFTIYWKDEENDEVAISSDDELALAVSEMKADVKKFFVKVGIPARHDDKAEVDDIHFNIVCDGCNGKVIGFRYKCLVCKDYDLCSECEQANVHSEHPVLRIPNPFLLDRSDINKIMRYFSSAVPMKCEIKHSRHRRRHSHEHSDSHKKRRCDKHDSGEESDENRRKKHFQKRCGYQRVVIASKKLQESLINQPYSLGVYSKLMNDFFTNVDPAHFQNEETFQENSRKKTNEETRGEPAHIQNLKSVAKTIFSLLNPLGIDVDFEVRPGTDAEEKPKEQKEPEKKEPTETSTTTPSAPPQTKEVRFPTNTEKLKQQVEEITKILANQTMNQSAENDGWVSFEELKRDSEGEPQPSTSTGTVLNVSKTEGQTSSQAEKTQETKNLYPTLKTGQELSSRSVVQNSLEKMLKMGFTNEGNWLTHLLELKNGNIDEVLEVLSPAKE